MKILMCSEFFYPSVGGVQEVIRQLATRMTEFGHKVTVATSYLPGRESNTYSGIEIRPFAIAGNSTIGMTGDIEAYRKFVSDSDFDLLFVYAVQQWTFDALLGILPDLKIPKVLVPCGYSGLMNPIYREYFDRIPLALRQFDAIVYHSKSYRDYSFGQLHGLEGLAVIIPNGADNHEFSVCPDSEFRKRNGISEDAILILTVGSLNGRKGHLELAKAFEQLDLGGRSGTLLLNGSPESSALVSAGMKQRIYKAFRFVKMNSIDHVVKKIASAILSAVGLQSDYFAKLEKCKKRINRSTDRKVIQVDLPRTELVQAYLAADLFVFASNVEYSPLVLYEACAAGLPFLSVSVGNAAEISAWTGGGEVLMVEPDSRGMVKVAPKVLASAIQRLLIDSGRRFELGKAGHKAWQSQFNWEMLAGEYMRLFESLAATDYKKALGK